MTETTTATKPVWNPDRFNVEIHHSWQYDESPDLSYLGEFTNDANAAGVIERQNAPSHEYKYFIPAQSEEELYNWYRTNVNPNNPAKRVYGVKTARRLAHEQTLADMRRAETCGTQWNPVCAWVILKINGITFDHLCVGGYESDALKDCDSDMDEFILELYERVKEKFINFPEFYDIDLFEDDYPCW